MTEFCCEKLQKECKDESSPFYMYGGLWCEGRYAKPNGMNTRSCDYCPFCGKKLE